MTIFNNLDTNICGPIPLVANSERRIHLSKPKQNDDGTYLTDLRTRVVKIEFICNDGFIINGDSQVICDENTTLYSEIPKCVANNTCGSAPEIDDGEIVWQTFVEASGYGDQAHYNCSNKFIMNGNPSITCQRNGQWSSIPNCGSEFTSNPQLYFV